MGLPDPAGVVLQRLRAAAEAAAGPQAVYLDAGAGEALACSPGLARLQGGPQRQMHTGLGRLLRAGAQPLNTRCCAQTLACSTPCSWSTRAPGTARPVPSCWAAPWRTCWS